MSRRPEHRGAVRLQAISIWMLALLVALIATIQIRSEAEVQKSLVGVDPTALAFLIDDLHRANDSLAAEAADLGQRENALQSGGGGVVDQELAGEASRLRAMEGLVPVQGPGVVIVVDAAGLSALDLQDAINNLESAGAEAVDVNGRRVVVGVPIDQTGAGVAVNGVMVAAPWTISVIGDSNRLGDVADLMTQQLRADRRVRSATYRVESDVVIDSVVGEKPFVYAVPS